MCYLRKCNLKSLNKLHYFASLKRNIKCSSDVLTVFFLFVFYVFLRRSDYVMRSAMVENDCNCDLITDEIVIGRSLKVCHRCGFVAIRPQRTEVNRTC